jgi:hypothetical protein
MNMMTRAQLLERERSFRDIKTLSVYVTGWSDDPAQRDAWRIELKNALEKRREALRNASHTEREAYDACVAHLRKHLDTVPGVLGDPGWVGFVTPDGVQHAEEVPLALPTRVDWGEGIQLAPYIRVLKQSVPAVVAVVDAREARVYRYGGDRLRKLATLHSHKHVEAPEHMGATPRLGFHPGTRGASGADEADRARLAGRAQMLRELTERMLLESRPGGWMLIGGIPEVVDAAFNALPESERSRARRIAHLDVHSSEAQIASAAERGATDGSRERDAAFVDEILALSGADGKGLAGWEGTLEALRQRAVNRLCFTDRFLREHAVEVERAVALALDQDAEVEHVSGAGAERLDSEGAGIGVRLRFLPSREQPPVVVTAEII